MWKLPDELLTKLPPLQNGVNRAPDPTALRADSVGPVRSLQGRDCDHSSKVIPSHFDS